MTHDHNNSELQHHGIKGQRWGVRRFQNKDGSLTPAGEKRQRRLEARRMADDLKAKRARRKLDEKKVKQEMKDDAADRAVNRKAAMIKAKAEAKATKAPASDDDLYDLPDDSSAAEVAEREKRAKVGKALAIGALAVVGTATAVYAYNKLKPKSAKEILDKKLNILRKNKKSDAEATKKMQDGAAKILAKRRARDAAKAAKDAAKEQAAQAARAKQQSDLKAQLLEKHKDRIYTKLFDEAEARMKTESVKNIAASSAAKAGKSVTLSIVEALKNRRFPNI